MKRDCSPQSGRDVLTLELENEYRKLSSRHLLSGKRKPERLCHLEHWLKRNPPPGWSYRCQFCLMGTGNPARECVWCVPNDVRVPNLATGKSWAE